MLRFSYRRDWRYHKEFRVWISRVPGLPVEKTAAFENGTYIFFDVCSWRLAAMNYPDWCWLRCMIKTFESRKLSKLS